ncbi:M48 family metallopeptidase [Lysobacter sp. N42]|uniref:M48 family metallopeptidase n=2 Tax=Gammaproteobacteria TaxID=1236 RepID=UPI001A9FDB39|nr:M48 family metallopeptidase [Lysobacter sp. N42]
MSSDQLNEMGRASFTQMKEEGNVTQDPELNAYVQCITDHLVAVLPQEYREYDWEVAVFEEETVNAFALPGGYMGVYTGMIRLAENQHQLAAVMGHEIGHVMAEHGGERMSGNILVSAGLFAADLILSDRPSEQRNLIMAGLGVGAQVGVLLPFSRTHESEADEIGLQLMAEAGFEPGQSVRLWELMAERSQGSGPEILSTHPAPESRIEDLGGQVPSVMPYYQERAQQGSLPSCEKPQLDSLNTDSKATSK